MGTSNLKSVKLVNTLLSISIVGLCWHFSYYLRFHSILEIYKGIPSQILYLKLLPFVLAIWFFIFSRTDIRKFIEHGRLTLLEILKKSAIAALFLVVFIFFYQEYKPSRVFLGIFFITHPIFIWIGTKLIMPAIVRWFRGHSSSKVLVVTESKRLKSALRFIDALTRLETINLSLILIDDSDNHFPARKNLRILQQPGNWSEFFRTNSFATAIVSLSNQESHFLDRNLDHMAEQIPNVKILPDIAKVHSFESGFEIINGQLAINIHDSPLTGVNQTLKRIFDFSISLLGIVLCSPIMLTIAGLIKLTSKGPILYVQERIGHDGKIFKMFKFRSMPVDAEKESGAVWCTASDNRATPFGKICAASVWTSYPSFLMSLKAK